MRTLYMLIFMSLFMGGGAKGGWGRGRAVIYGLIYSIWYLG